MEQSLIKALKSNSNHYGYNLTNGGDTRLHRSYKGKNNPQSKPIYQFDKDLKFIAKYPSSIEADAEIHSHSSEAAREGYLSGGFYWARENNICVDNNGNINMINKPLLIVRKEIFQFDKNFNYIGRYTSTRNVEIEIGVPHTTINAAAKRKNISHGFYWLYKEDVDLSEAVPQIKSHVWEALLKKQNMDKYQKEDGCIKIVNVTANELFSSIASASKYYAIDSSYLRKTAISTVTHNKRTAKKYKWLLYDDYLRIYNLTEREARKSLSFVM